MTFFCLQGSHALLSWCFFLFFLSLIFYILHTLHFLCTRLWAGIYHLSFSESFYLFSLVLLHVAPPLISTLHTVARTARCASTHWFSLLVWNWRAGRRRSVSDYLPYNEPHDKPLDGGGALAVSKTQVPIFYPLSCHGNAIEASLPPWRSWTILMFGSNGSVSSRYFLRSSWKVFFFSFLEEKKNSHVSSLIYFLLFLISTVG